MELVNVSKGFGGKLVIRNLSCAFPDGSVTVVQGISGVGKSTLINLLLGLTKCDSGTVEPARGRVGAVFQEYRLIEELTPMDNLRLVCPARVSDAELRTALEAVELKHALRQKVSTLSGGMKQRVSIARAAVIQPEILILDEPFKGLDADLRARVAAYLCSLNARITVIVAHDPIEAELMHATHSLVLREKALDNS